MCEVSIYLYFDSQNTITAYDNKGLIIKSFTFIFCLHKVKSNVRINVMILHQCCCITTAMPTGVTSSARNQGTLIRYPLPCEHMIVQRDASQFTTRPMLKLKFWMRLMVDNKNSAAPFVFKYPIRLSTVSMPCSWKYTDTDNFEQ